MICVLLCCTSKSNSSYFFVSTCKLLMIMNNEGGLKGGTNPAKLHSLKNQITITLFKIWPTYCFSKAKSLTFIFTKTMSHELLVQMAYNWQVVLNCSPSVSSIPILQRNSSKKALILGFFTPYQRPMRRTFFTEYLHI